MKHPEEIFNDIIPTITTDGFTAYVGKRPDQNFAADELTYPAAFLDTPLRSKPDIAINNVFEHNIPMSIFFAYKADLDSTSPQNFTAIKTKAWDAAREFIIRLKKYNKEDPNDNKISIKEIKGVDMVDVDNVFDINLCGCLLTFTVIISDGSSVCVS